LQTKHRKQGMQDNEGIDDNDRIAKDEGNANIYRQTP
jgi:hypothetical protein